jgi:hypothetical protein
MVRSVTRTTRPRRENRCRTTVHHGGTVGRVGTPEPHSIRIGNAERELAVTALGDHFAQGRLSPDEFEERMTTAYAARTAAELDRLFDDLPRPAPPPSPALPPTTAFRGPATPAYGSGYPVPQTGPYPVLPGVDPHAPYGREPVTGQPYSDKSKVVAGVLQLFLPFGVGRLYAGHTAIGIAQLLLTVFFGIGIIWAFVDGIVILAGRPTDPYGRPLHP